jgi:uncharacterized protein (TIRG00374 family)
VLNPSEPDPVEDDPTLTGSDRGVDTDGVIEDSGGETVGGDPPPDDPDRDDPEHGGLGRDDPEHEDPGHDQPAHDDPDRDDPGHDQHGRSRFADELFLDQPTDDETEELARDLLPEGQDLPSLRAVAKRANPRIRPFRFTLKALIAVVVAYFLLPGVLTGFQQAADSIRTVNPALIGLGFGLQVLALFCYSLLTRAALGTVGERLPRTRLFRIQLSTKALSNIVPGGNAAGSALGYRLLTLSGVSGPHAGFALATAGIGSAVVLNVIFWISLIVSIPLRGVNPAYGVAALAGVIVIGIAAGLVFGIMEGQGRAERLVRWIAGKLRLDEEKFAAALNQIAERLDELASDRQLLQRVLFWATVNWLVDAASLWVFIRAFGESVPLDSLLVVFGLANVLAAIPILPGGLGVVDATYVGALVGFGTPRRIAVPAVAAYRAAQYLFPILIGGIAYASLRVGPWRIEKRDRLARLRDLAWESAESGESRLDFVIRHGRRIPVDEHGMPLIADDGALPDDWLAD